MSDLDLRRLRFFVEVVKHGGFSAAAKALCSTQSTVSKAVKQLEDELGVTLLKRSSTRSDLTDEGRVVYEEGVRLLGAADQLRSDLDALKGLRRGRLALGLPGMGTHILLAEPLARYKLKYPLVDLVLEVASISQLERQLHVSGLDIAAVCDPPPDGLDFHAALDDELVVLLPSTHPLASRDSVELRELRDVPLFLCEQDFPAAGELLEAFEAASIEPRISARSDHLELLCELVRSGAGVAFAPSRVVAARVGRSIVALPLRGAHIPWRLGFGWVRGRHLSHAARAWVDHVGQQESQAATPVSVP
ncbi:LysR family transcriptional regulator [Ramlibacter sp.]|uniref:LysR family transcriptional regulator n=1 Tax=Ramlibacter sp. TaxID=1917967 RepID=UPI003D11A0DD